MPTKDSTVISTRVMNTRLEEIKARLAKTNMTLNAWLSWAIGLGLRTHRKKERENS